MDPQPERGGTLISVASYVRLVGGNRNFRRLWLAQIVSEIGDWFYTLSIYTLLLQLTGHASSVALALVLQVLPQTLVGPTAGVINDRLKRKHVMIAADLVRFVVVLAMLFVRSSFQHKGIGRKLLAAAAALVNDPDCEFTVNSSPNAVAAYEHLGFHAIGDEQLFDAPL